MCKYIQHISKRWSGPPGASGPRRVGQAHRLVVVLILRRSESFVRFLEIDFVGYFAHPRDSRIPITCGEIINWDFKTYIIMYYEG